MEKQKNLDPHRTQAIAWRDGQKKEIVVKCLNHPSVVAAMDDAAKANTGEMVLWGARKLRELGMAGKLNINEPTIFGDPEEVKQLKEQLADLEQQLKAAQGGEVPYIDTINSQQHLLEFYRHIVDRVGFVVDEEKFRFRKKDNAIWINPLDR